MDNQHLIGQVMLKRIGGSPVVIISVNRNHVRVNYASRFFGVLEIWMELSQLTTNPALVVQSVG